MQFPERKQLSGFFLVLYWPFCCVLWGMFSVFCMIVCLSSKVDLLCYVLRWLHPRQQKVTRRIRAKLLPSADTISLAPSVNRACKEKSGKEQSLYYNMRNFCNLIGLEQWYFSLIWNTYMWKLQNKQIIAQFVRDVSKLSQISLA